MSCNSDTSPDQIEIPAQYDKFEVLNAKNLTEEEISAIKLHTQIFIENQINSLSPKKLAFYLEIKNRDYPYRKKFICSAWMRGFCIFKKEDCLHAHGIDNLIYEKNDFNSDARQHYIKIENKQFVSDLSYVHLFEFTQLYYLPETSQDFEFSLKYINEDTNSRFLIRENTRIKLFEDFFLLILKTYPKLHSVEDFILQEFERIGIGIDSLGFNLRAKRIVIFLLKNLCYVTKTENGFDKETFYLLIRDKSISLHQYFKEKIIQALTELKQEGNELTETNIKMKINSSQSKEFKPSFDFYLTKDDMCFYKYFKFYSLIDPTFLDRCQDIDKIIINPLSNIKQTQAENELVQDDKNNNQQNLDNENNFESNLSDEQLNEQSNSILSSIQFNCCQENSLKTLRIKRLIQEKLSLKFATGKRKLCRYWMKGNCIFEDSECQFAHGIRELIYEKYDEHIDDPEYLEFVYQKNLKLEQSYISLFKEQPILIAKGIIESSVSQQQIDDEKDLRESIRAKMQEDAMEEFVDLIWKYYGKESILSSSFIVTEFQRVGFFKIGFALKPQMIIDILTKNKCFQQYMICPPLIKEVSILTPFPTFQVVLDDLTPKVLSIFVSKYKQETSQNLELKESQTTGQESSGDEEREEKQDKGIEEEEEENSIKFTVNEYEIKKLFYKEQITMRRIPPVFKVCKFFNKQLHEIIWEIINQDSFQELIKESIPDLDTSQIQKMIILDSDFELITVKAKETIQKISQKLIFPFRKFFYEVYKEFREGIRASSGFNKFRDGLNELLKDKFHCEFLNLGGNGNYLMQMKVIEERIKHLNQQQKQKNKSSKIVQDMEKTSDLSYLKSYVNDEFTFSSATRDLFHRIKVIDSLEGIKESALILNKAQFLGVDLEGNLSEQGKIELIQISYYNFELNEAEIFVFDFLTLENQEETFQYAKSVIKSIMENKDITKILQGCQKDSIALFHLVGSKIRSGIDTQVVHNYILQLTQIVMNKSSHKNGKFQEFTYYSSGLNAILQQYSAPNGINTLKTKFHNIFEDKEHSSDIILKRPINQEYLFYSSKDVEDLIPVYFLMIKKSFFLLRQIFKEIDLSLVGELLQSVSKIHCKYKLK